MATDTSQSLRPPLRGWSFPRLSGPLNLEYGLRTDGRIGRPGRGLVPELYDRCFLDTARKTLVGRAYAPFCHIGDFVSLPAEGLLCRTAPPGEHTLEGLQVAHRVNVLVFATSPGEPNFITGDPYGRGEQSLQS